MKITKLFMLTILTFLFFLQSNLMSASENFYKEAVNHFENKNFEKSKFLFQRNLVFNPKDDLSYLYLAKIYKEEKNDKELEKNLNTTLLLNPQSEEALYMLIELQLAKSNFSEVKELNEKFLLICSSLCNKKYVIAEKISNLQPDDDQKE